jgi:hypothetical protein
MRALLIILLFALAKNTQATGYYVDSRNGNDHNKGTHRRSPWKSLVRLQQVVLQPGDSILFSRGSSFTGPLRIEQSGEPGRYIVVRDYGNAEDPAPAFTNPVFAENNYGNCIRINGAYVLVENLYCYGTAAYSPIKYAGDGWPVWEMGAIHIARNAEHCVVRNNEIRDCVAGIRSNGAWAQITGNYIHDCNRLLSKWNWGPLGIWLGADHQELAYNRIINYSAVDPHITWGPHSYGGGADGGAFEIDDARYPKTDIAIHHNYTRDNQGFLEVTWTDVKQNPYYSGFRIHHNVSDDYQQFIALWRGENCFIDNNTIIRRKKNANDWGVFNITQRNSRNHIRNNIVVTEKDIVVFNTGRKGTAKPATDISHNLYHAASGKLVMGKEGPGEAAVFANPMLWQYTHTSVASAFSLLPGSPAINKGMALPYANDFNNNSLPQGAAMDIGAFEYTAPPQGLQDIPLAANGHARITIAAPHTSATQQYAAQELSRCLQQITGAAFPVSMAGKQAGPAIRFLTSKTMPPEDYSISINKHDLLLTGGSDRAILFAVYDLLRRLGCEWLAPDFDMYDGSAEYIPRKQTLTYRGPAEVYEHPQFNYRKLDIEEGRTHNIRNLKQLVEWMPKVRYNILMVPSNYQGAGRVKWDNWRDSITPELKKRGLLLEVGGHGYQNFLNAHMENGQLFSMHPEWFGKNKEGKPDPAENLVFNTANPEAVQYFLRNVLQYLREHPEIDIFDCWPPDVAKWAECEEMKALGTPEDRQAKLINQLDSAIATLNRNIRLEVIAYGQVLNPPMQTTLSKRVMVDICPINQTFEKNMYDTTGNVNAAYARAMLLWKQYFQGETGHYSYYRKYAWYSMPVIIPQYMQRDMQWYAGLPFQGISTYAEPGDWFTYELNHYALAGIAWNTHVDTDSLLSRYTLRRFGKAATQAMLAYRLLEETVRNYGSIPYTKLKKAGDIRIAAGKLRECSEQLRNMQAAMNDAEKNTAVKRLLLMFDYAIRDLGILCMRAENAPANETEEKIKELVTMLENHKDDGVFILRSKNNLATFIKHYQNIR